MLYEKIRHVLNLRGIADPPRGSVVLRNDGAGAFIATWDVTALGNLPTQAEIDAADATAGLAVIKAVQRDADIGRKAIKALAIATHKRFKAKIPTDATTADQWEAAIRAEYDGR